MRFFLSTLLGVFLVAPLCTFAITDSFSITPDGAETELLLKEKIDPIEIIEFSSDLENWIPVARNYENQWETIFPHAYDLSAVAGSTDQAMVMAMGEKGFYRKRSTSTINASSNRELASRFLMQATFGPSRAEIDGFPNVNSNTFGSPGDDSFVDWIDAQIAISPFYHRAYWRERSDPDYQDLSNQTILVLQSGGTCTFMVGDIISQTEGNIVSIGEISSINQNNNVLESINVTKRALEPFTVSFGAISLYNYGNTSSITYRDLLYDNTDSPTSWSIEMGTLSSPATVTVEFLPTPSQYSSGTFSLFNSIQTDIWDDSVDVLNQTATFKQVAQVSGVTSGATISGSIGTTHEDGYIELAAMRVTIDYNPGQLRYNIDFGPFDFDSDDNDAASGFGTNYYTWNTASNSASFNPFSAADPTFGDYASISETAIVDEDGYDTDVSLNSVSVIGNNGDHVLRSATPPVAIDAYSYSTLAVGSTTSSPSGGRNAVLVFELPNIGSDEQIHSATVAVTVERLNQKTDFDADLWSLGIYDSNGTDPDGDGLFDYHEISTGNTNLVKLQDAFLNDLIAGTDSETQSVRVTSSPVSRLSDYLWQFYNSNPDYSGGKYLHLRVSPEIGSINDIGGENVRYTIKAAHNDNSDQEKPELTIELKDLSDVATKRFYRVRYGED